MRKQADAALSILAIAAYRLASPRMALTRADIR
jgi:hypothetical protein